MSDKTENTKTSNDNNDNNFSELIANYLKSQQIDKDKDKDNTVNDKSTKPINLSSLNQNKNTKQRVSGLRSIGDTKSRVRGSIRNRSARTRKA
jgi:hypothetical protein|tara:strand:+ start:5545 stop:5823 length:279 start_codon:yes stop_codon:yes gene_type:complete